MEDFALFPLEGAHRGTFCVWELGPVAHEKTAWVSFLMSERTGRDRQQYLENAFRRMV